MAKRPRKARYETSPERWALITETFGALGDHIADLCSDEGRMRGLAERLRVPYLALQMVPEVEFAGITDKDIDDYVAWRAAVSKKAG